MPFTDARQREQDVIAWLQQLTEAQTEGREAPPSPEPTDSPATPGTEKLDAVLHCQTLLLHNIFTQALMEYAGAEQEETAKLYSSIALKAQSYCRMTVGAIVKMKLAASPAASRKKRKIEDPAINEAAQNAENRGSSYYEEKSDEAMDTGGTEAAGGTDQRVAAMEGGSPQNR